jgi:uncharacterized RDD family membrane protein YckC
VSTTTGGYAEGNLGPLLAGDDLLTGEAVALDMPAAALGMRAMSGLLDLILTASIGGTIMSIALAAVASSLDPAATAGVAIVLSVLLFVGVPTVMETFTGRTFAKMMLGLRTLRDDGGPVSFRHALTRHLVGLVEVYVLMGAPALVCGLLNRKSKRLGDLAAGTYVVRDRIRPPWPKTGVVPPPLVAWAGTADIAPLPDHLALSIRELLARASEIRPQPRYQLANALARQATAYVSPGPPLGTPPEVFLEALLVERGRRDWLRLQRDEALRRRLTGHP